MPVIELHVSDASEEDQNQRADSNQGLKSARLRFRKAAGPKAYHHEYSNQWHVSVAVGLRLKSNLNQSYDRYKCAQVKEPSNRQVSPALRGEHGDAGYGSEDDDRD